MLVSFKLGGRQKNEQVQYRTSANEANVTNKCYHTKHTRTNVPRLVPYRKFCRACCLRPGGVLTRPGTRAHVAVPSANWLAREHTKPSSAMSRSVSPYAPVVPSWDWASRPFIHARRLCLWNTRVRTRHHYNSQETSALQSKARDEQIRSSSSTDEAKILIYDDDAITSRSLSRRVLIPTQVTYQNVCES